jgi:hypothetical protein
MIRKPKADARLHQPGSRTQLAPFLIQNGEAAEELAIKIVAIPKGGNQAKEVFWEMVGFG